MPKHIRRSRKRRPAWMTTRILREIRSKRKLWRLFESNKFADILDRFKDKVRRLISSAKFVFEKDLANNIKDNPKAFYGYVRYKQRVKDVVGPLRILTQIH